MGATITPASKGFRTGHFLEDARYETYRPNGTRDWLLIYTVTGEGAMRYGGTTAYAPPRTVLLFPPHSHQHYLTSPRQGTWELIWAHFHAPSRWRDLLHWPASDLGPYRLDLKAPRAAAQVDSALREMIDANSRPVHRRVYFAVNALERALLWCDTANPNRAEAHRDTRINESLEYISAHLTDYLDTPTLAAQAGLSPSRFSHLFSDEMGMPVQSYVEAERLERARELIEFSDRAISQIASSVGYRDPFYFSKRFSVRFGQSPSATRRRARPD